MCVQGIWHDKSKNAGLVVLVQVTEGVNRENINNKKKKKTLKLAFIVLNHNHRKLTNLITWTISLSNSMKL